MVEYTQDDVKISSNEDKLISAIEHWLELFDLDLALENVPVHSRPVLSAMRLVRDGISEVINGSKENFLEEAWFAAIVSATRKWYERRFGLSALEPARNYLSGVVLIHNTPIMLSMPTTVSRVAEEGKTSWLTFPSSVHEAESIMSFFPTKPSIDALDCEERAEVERQVHDIVKWSRSSVLSLQFSSDLSDEASQMAEGVWGHVEKAVIDILTLKQARAAVGCWDLHLGVEKAFKVLLKQNNAHGWGHCLNNLAEEVAAIGFNVSPSALMAMPNSSAAIKFRYGEQVIDIAEAIEVYRAAVQLIYELTTQLRGKYILNNASFLLKKPRWVVR